MTMDYQNLAELHRRQAERLGPGTALRYKALGLYHDLTWDDYHRCSLACASALVDVGIQPGERVGLFSENRYEWLMADMGILAAGAVNVTPHAPLTARQVHYELADSEASWLFVSNTAQRNKIEQIRSELPHLKGVVVFEPEAADTEMASWRAFLHRGQTALPSTRSELKKRERELNPDSLATLMYTSGTTGQPKGVMLTHGNLLSNTLAVLQISPATADDVLLSWLPYSHIYARTVDHYRSIVGGMPVCLAENAETLVLNLAEIQPTQMCAVPRFYEKLLAAVQDENPKVTHARLRAVFGPRIDYLSSGGAPLPPAVCQIYHDAGLLLLQGYGLTESSPVISFNHREEYKIETVGKPIPGVEVKISPEGEILSKGPHIMKGYWKKPKETEETIRDGWLYTGDLGSLDENGFLTITGRKKELMVLSNGKKVVPSWLEGLMIADPCIDQVVVCGEARNFLTALVVPNWPEVRGILAHQGVPVESMNDQELTQSDALYALLESRIHKALEDVSQWEKVKKFVILERPFSVEAEELTVSLKLRRGVILERYQEVLDRLYESGKKTEVQS